MWDKRRVKIQEEEDHWGSWVNQVRLPGGGDPGLWTGERKKLICGGKDAQGSPGTGSPCPSSS